MIVADAPTQFTLRCHSCSHAIGTVAALLELSALFKPSRMGRISRTHPKELRVRCKSCGWVNVFHPLTRGGEEIELKA